MSVIFINCCLSENESLPASKAIIAIEKKELPILALNTDVSSDQECVVPAAVPEGTADTEPVNAEHPFGGEVEL
jgi:hypothetical protein